MREETILSPSQVSGYIKSWMDRDRLLSGLLVRGELSNYKMYPSGHHYFTLKDSQGALRCVMFRGDAASLRFRPENGMQVIAAGRITVFPRDGQYQLYCVRLTPEGAGDLHVAFEQLKEKLLREGLFDQAHKRPLPAYPRRIALITSPAGAAVRDMLRILGARYPLAQVRVLPVRVQGEGAAEEIAAALDWANLHQAADLIITGRQAIDGDTAQVGPQVAEKLGLPQVTYAEEILDIKDSTLVIRRRLNCGTETVECPVPAVITVNASAPECRPRNAKRVMTCKFALSGSEIAAAPESEAARRAAAKPYLQIVEWAAADVDPDPQQLGLQGSPTKVKKIENVVFQAKEAKKLTAADEDINSLMVELIASHTLG